MLIRMLRFLELYLETKILLLLIEIVILKINSSIPSNAKCFYK